MIRYLRLLLLVVPFSFFWMFPENGNTQYDSSISSSVYSKDSIAINYAKYKCNGVYVINDTIDLHGKTWYMPQNISVKIDGGFVKNGVIDGNNTTLEAIGCVFDKVKITGCWKVADIRTSMFRNLDYDNSLKDVFAFTNPDVINRVIVENGDYFLRAINNSDECIRVVSRTDVILDGNVRLHPNEFTNYSILYLTGNNISIRGNGSIVGDKHTHTGTKGEWGMGVYIAGGENLTIKGISINDCWGDCVYVTKNAKNVVIEDCIIDNGRRQGISIISAQNVLIRNCSIRNINGTNPAYAIDVEPNKGDKIADVLVENVAVNNCRGGFASYGKARDAHIGKVVIKNCTVEKTEQIPLSFVSTNSVEVDDCRITGSRVKQAIECFDVDDVSLKSIRFDGRRIRNNRRGKKLISVKNIKRQIIQ